MSEAWRKRAMNEHDNLKVSLEPSPNHPKVITSFEDVRKEAIEKLKQIESNLRIKGDIWRAERVLRFRLETFGE